MQGVNEVTIIGNVGSDPILRYTSTGSAVCNFSVATTEKYKDKNGEWQESTEWHKMTAWNKNAEFVKEYVSKGTMVYVNGKLKTSKYTVNDGSERYKTEIVVNKIQSLIRSKYDNDDHYKDEYESKKGQESFDSYDNEDDQLPF